MGLFEWTPIYATGVPEIDAQHKQLMGYVNVMFDAMLNDAGAETVGHVLDRLSEYTAMHFAFEERLLIAGAAKGLEAHLALHEDLLRRVMELRDRHLAGDPRAGGAAIDLLRDWLVDHILNEDVGLGPAMRAGMKAIAAGRSR